MDFSGVVKTAKNVGPFVGMAVGIGMASFDVGKERAYLDEGAKAKATEVETSMMKRLAIVAGVPLIAGFGTMATGVFRGRQGLINTGLAIGGPAVGAMAGAMLALGATGELWR